MFKYFKILLIQIYTQTQVFNIYISYIICVLTKNTKLKFNNFKNKIKYIWIKIMSQTKKI